VSAPPRRVKTLTGFAADVLDAAVLAALWAAEAAEAAATPAPWFAAAQRGKMPVVGVPAGEDQPARALAVFGHAGTTARAADARLVAELRNTAPTMYASIRETVERHGLRPDGAWPGCLHCVDGPADDPIDFPCVDYRAAARMIPNLPEDVTHALARD